MNQRIRELAEQARQDYLKNHWPSGISSDNVGMYPQLMERFAELIVEECAGIYSKIDNGNLHMGTDDYLEALHKTFFGVEE